MHIISVCCICVAEPYIFCSNFRSVFPTSVIKTVVMTRTTVVVVMTMMRWAVWWGLKGPKPGTSMDTEKPTRTWKHKKKKVDDALLAYLEQLQQQWLATSLLRAKVFIRGLMKCRLWFKANTQPSIKTIVFPTSPPLLNITLRSITPWTLTTVER